MFNVKYENKLNVLVPLYSPLFGFNSIPLYKYTQYFNIKSIDLIVLPELASAGYYAKDLYLFPEKIIELNNNFINKLARFCGDESCKFLTSLPLYSNDGKLYNTAVLIDYRVNTERNKNKNDALMFGQEHITRTEFNIQPINNKKYLPNYNIFNERRYFTPGDKPYSVLNIKNFKIGVFICEDSWYFENWKELLESEKDIDLIISINASPFEYGKLKKKIQMFREYVTETKIPFLYVNYYGAFDEITFDGNNFYINPSGVVFENIVYLQIDKNGILRSKILSQQNYEFSKVETNNNDIVIRTNFENYNYISYEEIKTITTKNMANEINAKYLINTKQSKEEQIVNAIRLNLETYMRRANFKDVVIGISGGIDSATVLYLIKDISNINIHAYFLPIKPFTSVDSYKAVELIEKNTGIKIETVELTNVFNTAKQIMNISDELALANLQSRLRANYLLSKANELNAIVLTCSNKTELAYGYYTLGGDSEGGYAPLKDVLKTEVFEIAKYLGVPEFIINRKPTAELFKDGKTDEEELGVTYNELDSHLKLLIEEKIITDINKRILKFEFKRIQAPIGPKLTNWSFNEDWKFPILSL